MIESCRQILHHGDRLQNLDPSFFDAGPRFTRALWNLYFHGDSKKTSSKRLEFISSAKPICADGHKILRINSPLRDPYLGGGDLHLAMQVSERIIELKEDLEKLGEEKRVLDTEIVRVAPFGDFSMDDIDYIERETGRKVQFFCMKTAKSHKTSFPEEIIYVSTEYDLDYFITISSEPITLPGMIEMRIDAAGGRTRKEARFCRRFDPAV
jgi:hypothetical protein